MARKDLFGNTALALTVAALSIPLTASAASPGFYVGASIGSSAFDDEFNEETIDDNDVGYKLFVGYRLNEYLAIEGGYRDFGEIQTSVTAQTVTAKSDGWDLFAVLGFPAGPIDLFGKVGVISWDYSTEAAALTRDENGEDFAWGLGAQWNITQNLGLRLEYEVFELTDPHSVDMVSAGVVWTFR